MSTLLNNTEVRDLLMAVAPYLKTDDTILSEQALNLICNLDKLCEARPDIEPDLFQVRTFLIELNIKYHQLSKALHKLEKQALDDITRAG